MARAVLDPAPHARRGLGVRRGLALRQRERLYRGVVESPDEVGWEGRLLRRQGGEAGRFPTGRSRVEERRDVKGDCFAVEGEREQR